MTKGYDYAKIVGLFVLFWIIIRKGFGCTRIIALLMLFWMFVCSWVYLMYFAK